MAAPILASVSGPIAAICDGIGIGQTCYKSTNPFIYALLYVQLAVIKIVVKVAVNW